MANIQQVELMVARSEEGVPVTIFEPDFRTPYFAPDGSKCTISVLGPESKAWRAADRAYRAKTRGFLTEEDEAEADVERAAAIVVAWHGWTETQGKGEDAQEVPWPCTPKHVKALLHAKHIRTQVLSGVLDHASLFTKRSA